MAGAKPGPTCGFERGPNWNDEGTTCRSLSPAPGPLGFVMSLVMGASPQDKLSKNDLRTMQAMFGVNIDKIASSPFGSTPEGKKIVGLLRRLNDGGNIVYGGNLHNTRGDWDGKVIRIDEAYRSSSYRTITELVHEATHALWRKTHPLSKSGTTASANDDIDDELHARENQLIMYQYLRDQGGPEDAELEIRLQRQRAGTLRQSIAAAREE